MRLTANRLTLPTINRDDEFELLQKKIVELLQRSPVITFAVCLLALWTAVIFVGGQIWGNKVSQVTPSANAVSAPKIAGLSQTVPSSELEAKLHAITTQPATLTIGGETLQLSQERIRSWLVIKHDDQKSVDHIYVSSAAMTKSLNELANKYVKAPINQVVATRSDGSSEVIVAGRNGTQLVNPAALQEQVKQSAKNVMDAKGLSFTTELAPLEFQSITPAAFNKLIEVDVVTKQMYLYEKGNLVKSYPISAGAPETPTPIGQFKIYAKFTKQDMRGDNADGTRYFQPNVRWISYFKEGGYAIHGNYWRPASWFGRINSSHGCVSLPDHQAKEVFDWAPIGTTIITHY